MSEKRRDNKGRILKDGEGQRKNGTYDYRYTDINGKRRSVYAATLKELREKEEKIQNDLNDGINTYGSEITVIDLLNLYLSQKQGLRKTTKHSYQIALHLLEQENFCRRKINTINLSDAKAFLIKLQNDGRSYGTICITKNLLKPAFSIAVEDNRIRRNPFDFYLSSIISNNTKRRNALTPEEKEAFLNFIKSDESLEKYLNEIAILLGTGLRVSELYGLTISDIDFENRKIRINKQLQKQEGGVYYIEKPKSKSGVRFIPIIKDDVVLAFQDAIRNRKAQNPEIEIDGYSGFIFLNRRGKPKTSINLEQIMRRIVRLYNESHDDKLPHITPHVLRHTYCTELALSGINVKGLQYLMGHSDVYTTLNIYTDTNYNAAKEALEKVTGAM